MKYGIQVRCLQISEMYLIRNLFISDKSCMDIQTSYYILVLVGRYYQSIRSSRPSYAIVPVDASRGHCSDSRRNIILKSKFDSSVCEQGFVEDLCTIGDNHLLCNFISYVMTGHDRNTHAQFPLKARSL